MSDPTLRQRLDALTLQFVQNVLDALRTTPLQDLLTELAGPATATRSVRETSHEPRGARRAAGAATTPKLQRRSGSEMDRIRDAIVRALRSAARPVGAGEIAREVAVPTSALAFPMARLRAQGVIVKSGERAQAVYALANREDSARKSRKRQSLTRT